MLMKFLFLCICVIYTVNANCLLMKPVATEKAIGEATYNVWEKSMVAYFYDAVINTKKLHLLK